MKSVCVCVCVCVYRVFEVNTEVCCQSIFCQMSMLFYSHNHKDVLLKKQNIGLLRLHNLLLNGLP